MKSSSGSAPLLIIDEKVAGLPSYTGRYFAKDTKHFCVAVMHIQSGGLDASYFDNQWLMDEPVIERIDDVLDFDWGLGPITNYGRDYVSIRWWGKLKPETTDTYTFFITADDGVRLFIDHDLIIDMWQLDSVEKKASIQLVADTFYDIKMEYKDETGKAHIRLEWSSNAIKRSLIPSDQLYYATHISGSPFSTEVVPGAADYPFSDLVDVPGGDRFTVVAGELARFFIEAKVSQAGSSISVVLFYLERLT